MNVLALLAIFSFLTQLCQADPHEFLDFYFPDDSKEIVFKYELDFEVQEYKVSRCHSIRYDVVLSRGRGRDELLVKLENAKMTNTSGAMVKNSPALRAPFSVHIDQHGKLYGLILSPKEDPVSIEEKMRILDFILFNKTEAYKLVWNRKYPASLVQETALGSCPGVAYVYNRPSNNTLLKMTSRKFCKSDGLNEAFGHRALNNSFIEHKTTFNQNYTQIIKLEDNQFLYFNETTGSLMRSYQSFQFEAMRSKKVKIRTKELKFTTKHLSNFQEVFQRVVDKMFNMFEGYNVCKKMRQSSDLMQIPARCFRRFTETEVIWDLRVTLKI